jgi:hypothetical protein
VSGLSPALAEVVRARFGPLVAPAGDEHDEGGTAATVLPLVVRRVDASMFLPAPAGTWEYSFDLDPTPDAVRIAGPGFMAVVTLGARPAAELHTAHADAEFAGVFENVFRVLAAYALLRGDALLLHSAAVEVDGRALVFFGPSGVGKSTMARRAAAAGLRVLSDDLNALRIAGATSMVEKVPFAGDFGGGPEPMPALAATRKLGPSSTSMRRTPFSSRVQRMRRTTPPMSPGPS